MASSWSASVSAALTLLLTSVSLCLLNLVDAQTETWDSMTPCSQYCLTHSLCITGLSCVPGNWMCFCQDFSYELNLFDCLDNYCDFNISQENTVSKYVPTFCADIPAVASPTDCHLVLSNGVAVVGTSTSLTLAVTSISATISSAVSQTVVTTSTPGTTFSTNSTVALAGMTSTSASSIMSSPLSTVVSTPRAISTSAHSIMTSVSSSTFNSSLSSSIQAASASISVIPGKNMGAGRISNGAIVGITLGTIFALISLIAAGIFFLHQKQEHNEDKPTTDREQPSEAPVNTQETDKPVGIDSNRAVQETGERSWPLGAAELESPERARTGYGGRTFEVQA